MKAGPGWLPAVDITLLIPSHCLLVLLSLRPGKHYASQRICQYCLFVAIPQGFGSSVWIHLAEFEALSINSLHMREVSYCGTPTTIGMGKLRGGETCVSVS